MDLRPFDVVGGEMKRYGRAEDGGYVIYDNPLGATHILGYGVDKDVSFENELTEAWNVNAHVFDHTIDEVPQTGPRVTYIKEGIGAEDAPPLFSLENHVKRFVPDGSNFVLKMDVEGAEWEVLMNADLSRVSQLIVEFHDLQDHLSFELFKKLNETFYLVHIHGNNSHNQPWAYINRYHKMPRFIECTYVRKDLVTAVPTTKKFPTPLDAKCREDVPELELDFWEPCDKPISFIVQKGTDTTLLKRLVTPEDEIIEQYGDLIDCQWPRQFLIKNDDIFPYEIIMRLRTLPEYNVKFQECLNFACHGVTRRYMCASQDEAEVKDVIYRHK
jgi:hypothetical protein